jgi:hypothetical protein
MCGSTFHMSQLCSAPAATMHRKFIFHWSMNILTHYRLSAVPYSPSKRTAPPFEY